MNNKTILLHRFCSMAEYKAYRRGDRLVNHSNHNPRATTSVGFCFFSDDTDGPDSVDRWSHRLNGLVDFDVLLTVRAPLNALQKSRGVYTNWDAPDPIPAVFTEYSTESYDRHTFELVAADLSFANNPQFISRSEAQRLLNCLTHPL